MQQTFGPKRSMISVKNFRVRERFPPGDFYTRQTRALWAEL